jgi:hypothetical protein
MDRYMLKQAESENGLALLLRLGSDRVLSSSFIFLSLCLGSWLVSH